jgi:pentafunctional AROM polypeptide
MISTSSDDGALDIISSNFRGGRQSFIISLTYSDLAPSLSALRRISYGGQVWELRVDLLRTTDLSKVPSRDYVASQLQTLRQASSLPIIFAIRTVSQGGQFPDDAVDEALELMLTAIDLGCEYVDVQVSWPARLIDQIAARKREAKLIASFGDEASGTSCITSDLESQLRKASFGGLLYVSQSYPRF